MVLLPAWNLNGVPTSIPAAGVDWLSESESIDDSDCAAVSPGTVLLPQVVGPQSSFGNALGISGEWIAVGVSGSSPMQFGRVELFRLVEGTWIPHGVLEPEDATPGNAFGRGVALHHDVLVVGAPGGVDNGVNTGLVQVYELTGDAWTPTAKLVAPDGEDGDKFGDDVALEGDLIAIGARGHDASGSGSGAVYLFWRVDGAWTLQAKLLAPDGAAGDDFGAAIAIDNGTVAVTALGDDGPHSSLAGSIRIFQQHDGIWTQTASLSTTGTPFAVPPLFGLSLVMQNGRLIATSNFSGGRGALEFAIDGEAWLGPRLLTALEGYTNTFRLLALDPAADRLVWAGGSSSQGVVLTVLHRDAAGWAAQHRIKPPGGSGAPACRVASDGVHLVMARSSGTVNGQTTPFLYVTKLPSPDRDANGLADDCELATGLAEDCDQDGIVDDAQMPLRYQRPSGPIANSPSFIAISGPSTQALILNHFVVSGGGGMIRSLRYLRPNVVPRWAAPTEGIALVYLDPDGDGDPVDAVLLSSQKVSLESNVALPYKTYDVSIPIEPVEVGPEGTSFFLGLSVITEPFKPFVGIHFPALHRPMGWISWNAQGLNLEDLSTQPPKLFATVFSPSSLALSILGLEAEFTDCDESGRLDDCEILEGALEDIDGDGIPDLCQPPLADLDGDGVVDSADLGILLSAWGECPPAPTSCPADLDGDGEVGASDLGRMLAAWTG